LVRRDIGLGERGVVAGVGDVEVVFEGKSDGVLETDVEFAFVDQVFQTWRVVESSSGALLGR